jgi:invasion protein IalB
MHNNISAVARAAGMITALLLLTGFAARAAVAPDVAADQDRVTTQPSAPAKRRSTCARLKTLVGKLGETYAGHRLRETWPVRLCAMTETTFDDGIWAWPWGRSGHTLPPNDTHLAADRLPPMLLRSYGAWDVRCGRVGLRQRCALVRTIQLPMTEDRDAAEITVHFVLDAVAGREIVLWRVRVEGARHESAPIHVRLHNKTIREPFDHCTAGGCIMEADIATSTDVATRLWDGDIVDLLLGANADAATIRLPTAGFREAFHELVRLRREDRGQTASGVVP